MAVRQSPGPVFLQHLPLQALPSLQRKAARFRHARGERTGCQRLAHAPSLEHGRTALTQARRLLRSRILRCCVAPRLGRRCARSDTKLPLPTRRSMNPSACNWLYADSTVSRETPRDFANAARCGQRLADVERTIEDQLPDGALDARMQRQGAMRRVAQPGFTDSSWACLNNWSACHQKWLGATSHFEAYKTACNPDQEPTLSGVANAMSSSTTPSRPFG
jgi:hypothetical protein